MEKNNSSELTKQNSSISDGQIREGVLLHQRYSIGTRLGEGGMGVTYKACDETTGTTVAIKFLNQERIANEKDLRRFQLEGKTASKLHHTGICRVLDFAILENEHPYFVMEYIEGNNLADCLKREGQLKVDETLDLFIQICDALSYAHANGVLHRDIKPSNIMVSRPTNSIRATLLDFGVAKCMTASGADSQSITDTGELLGSPLYMSPEQARGGALDARSDLYSLGCTLYETLTGGPPHLGQSTVATLLKRERDKPIALSEASMGKNFSEQLEHVVSRLLQLDPADRYQTADQVKNELLLVREGKLSDLDGGQDRDLGKIPPSVPTSSRRPYYLSVLVAVLIVVIGAACFLYNTSRRSSPAALPSTEFQKWPKTDEQKFSMLDVNEHLKQGDSLYLRKQFGPAAAEFESAKELLVNNKMQGAPLRRCMRSLALCYLNLQKYAEALPYCESAASISKADYGPSSWEYVESLNHLGSVYVMLAKPNDQDAWKKASQLFQKSQDILRTTFGPNSTKLAECLAFQGVTCSSKQAAHAQPLLEKAKNIYRKNKNAEKAAQLLAALGNAYAIQNNDARAEECWNQALGMFGRQSNGESDLYQQILYMCAHYTNDLKSPDSKSYKRARALILHWLPRFQAKQTPFLGPLLLQLGEIDMRIGLDDNTWPIYQREALALIQQGVNILSKPPDAGSLAIVSAYWRIGQIQFTGQHYAEARSAELKALDVLERNKLKDNFLKLSILLQLASIYPSEGNFIDGARAAEQGLSLIDETPLCKNTYMHACFLSLLANASVRQHDWAKAEELLKRSRAICANLKDKASQAEIRKIDITLAQIHQANGK